jgi:hypothetical protein
MLDPESTRYASWWFWSITGGLMGFDSKQIEAKLGSKYSILASQEMTPVGTHFSSPQRSNGEPRQRPRPRNFSVALPRFAARENPNCHENEQRPLR